MINKLLNKIEEYNTIIIHRHNRPDGDAIGTQVGLCLALRDKYPQKNIYMVGDINPRLTFAGKMDEINDDVYNDALVIIVDVAVSYMVSDDRYKLAKELFIIDHHKNLSDIEDTNLIIDSTAAAASQVVAQILYDNNFYVSPDAATALYLALVTDSGRFQYGDTTPATMLIASKLLASGARAQEIFDKLYVESLESKKLKAIFTERMQVTSKNVGYLINTKEDLEKYNISFNDCSRGMVNVMAGIEGINIWANFTYDETKDVVVCEFRSRGLTIVDIAKKYGGGGHDQACGCSLPNFEMVQDVLADFDLRMEEFLNGTNS